MTSVGISTHIYLIVFRVPLQRCGNAQRGRHFWSLVFERLIERLGDIVGKLKIGIQILTLRHLIINSVGRVQNETEVESGTSNTPEQIRIGLCRSFDDGRIGQHDIHGKEAVDDEAIQSLKPSNAATQSSSNKSNTRATPDSLLVTSCQPRAYNISRIHCISRMSISRLTDILLCGIQSVGRILENNGASDRHGVGFRVDVYLIEPGSIYFQCVL